MMPTFLHPLQDTIYTPGPTDTVPVSAPINTISGRSEDSVTPLRNADSGIVASPPLVIQKPVSPNTRVQETPVIVQKKAVEAQKWNSSNFFTENPLKGIVSDNDESKEQSITYGVKQRPDDMIPAVRDSITYDWLLGIFLFLVVLFVWIRVFYSKFFATLANALVSFQLSVKLFQERNVLLQRVSIVLDFIYIIVTAIFVFEVIEYSGFSKTGMSGIKLFLLLLNILMLYAILRVVVLRMTGSLFRATPLFSEYIHNTFVINKGMGILLFPIVIMAEYLPYELIPVVLILGTTIIAVAFLFKSFRAYQIIIRRDILLFYLILYLCTLEILPLLLGYKFVTSLIQSN